MCKSISETFAWIGAVLVNIGFIALIAWGSSTLWPLGFFFAAIYTACLFSLARALQQRGTRLANDDGLETVVEEEVNDNAEDEAAAPAKVPMGVNLLYGLAVISMGVTLSLLPVNLVDNCAFSEPDTPSSWRWTTNLTEVPPDLHNWATSEPKWKDFHSTVAYVESTKTTLFRGDSPKTQQTGFGPFLWTVSSRGKPLEHTEFLNPGDMVTVSSSTVCFTSYDGKHRYSGMNQVYCSDGKAFREAKPDEPNNIGEMNSLVNNDGVLWYKQSGHWSGTGSQIYSMNTSTMKSKLHSRKVKSDAPQQCNVKASKRKQSVALSLFAVLPATWLAIRMWRRQMIPSMVFITYVGFTIFYLSAYTCIHPEGHYDDKQEWWMSLWFCLSGCFCLLAASYYNLRERTQDKERPPLHWGLAVGGVAFARGTTWLLLADHDTLSSWTLYTHVVVLPILLLGLANYNRFLIWLGGMGLFADAVRFTGFVGDQATGNASDPLTFMVFAVSGLILGGIGFKLTQLQPVVERKAKALVDAIDSCRDSAAEAIVDEEIAASPQTEQSEPLIPPAEEENETPTE